MQEVNMHGRTHGELHSSTIVAFYLPTRLFLNCRKVLRAENEFTYTDAQECVFLFFLIFPLTFTFFSPAFIAPAARAPFHGSKHYMVTITFRLSQYLPITLGGGCSKALVRHAPVSALPHKGQERSEKKRAKCNWQCSQALQAGISSLPLSLFYSFAPLPALHLCETTECRASPYSLHCDCGRQATHRSRTLASESRGEPDPELVLLAMRCEGSRLFVDGGVPSRTVDSRRICCCCCWKAAARAALAESSMITLGAGCGMICTPEARGGGRGSPLAVTGLDLSALTGDMVILELSVIGTLAEEGICWAR